MKFEYAKFDSLKIDLDLLDEIMHQFGLVRAGQWDYERVTYDRKFEFQRDTFYLRVQGHAISGDVGGRHAVIHLMTPLLGKHYYPHGVEYGDGEYFPPSLVEQCEKILSQIKSQLETVQL